MGHKGKDLNLCDPLHPSQQVNLCSNAGLSYGEREKASSAKRFLNHSGDCATCSASVKFPIKNLEVTYET